MIALRLIPVLILALTGCKAEPPPIVAVTGQVTLDGLPLPKVEVRFYPTAESLPADYIGIAVTDDNGNYSLMTNNQSGACIGINKVTVEEGPPPEGMRDPNKFDRYKNTLKNRPIPTMYASVASSPLEVTVTAGQSEYPLKLKR